MEGIVRLGVVPNVSFGLLSPTCSCRQKCILICHYCRGQSGGRNAKASIARGFICIIYSVTIGVYVLEG